MACTSIDGYLSTWDWDWWKAENPREEFEKGTYDIEDMASEITYEIDEAGMAYTAQSRARSTTTSKTALLSWFCLLKYCGRETVCGVLKIKFCVCM